MRYALFLLSVLGLVYCAQPEKPAKPAEPAAPAQPAEPTPPPGPDLSSAEAIDVWFKDIQSKESSMKATETTISRGDSQHKLKVFNEANGKPQVLKADIQGGKMPNVMEYYLADGKVVLLRELVMGKSNTENRFYFAGDQLLKAQSRTVQGRMAIDAVPFGEYKSPYGDLDFRLKFQEVQASADNYLQGK